MLTAQVEVNVNFDVRHVVGGIDSFEREKFIVLHSSPDDTDYNGIDDKLDSLVNVYDAYFGRETGRMRFVSSQVGEDPDRPGYADPAGITEWGDRLNGNYANRTNRHGLEKGRLITAAQSVPFYPNGANPVNANAPSAEHWFFSTVNTVNEPFASATGEYIGRFLRDGYGEGGTDGPPRPTFVEVMNEPIWPLVDASLFGGGNIDDIFTMHLTVADSVRKYSPESLIGGYCTAFPDFEKFGAAPANNRLFGQWEERWRRFVDEIGPEMDFYSLHFYDFHSLGGKELLRKGSNMEATLDMLEHYGTITDGRVKPMVISEYGAQLNDFYPDPWSPGRDWLILKSFSSMMMQFMERPNTIEKTVPFALHKAEFGFGDNGPGIPYPWRLLRRANEPADYSGDWVFTEVVKFYELWSDVRGTRVDTRSSDVDIMVDAFVDRDNNKGYLVLNSLDEAEREIDLSTVGISVANVSGVKIKHLFLDEAADAPVLDVTEMTLMPASVTLAEEACMIIELTFTASPEITESSTEEKIYATTYKQAITAGRSIDFTLPGISAGEQGEAVLRLGVGRAPGAERIPSVVVNGTSVAVPTDYRGDVQEDRDIFFGVLEIPVPYDLLTDGENLVGITFPDAGGFVSSCALQTFAFTREIARNAGPDRERLIVFMNRDEFIPEGGAVPRFNVGRRFTAELAYQTGITNGLEEDLNYVAMQVRQVDENSATVNTSAFNAVISGEEANRGRRSIAYVLPDTFDDGSAIPPTADLPEGHSLLLLIFMSVDDDAGFADANSEIIIRLAPDRQRDIRWTNKDAYVPSDGGSPTFVPGETFPVKISYATGSSGGVEEQLSIITMMVRQVDADNAPVKTSTFNVIASNSAGNEGELDLNYTLPRNFDDGSVIPTTAQLPAGHRLLLLLEMQTEEGEDFADDNTEITIIEDQGDRERAVSFSNKADYIPAGASQPVFEAGETFSATIKYGTARTDNVEEELNYVAMMVRQVDNNFAIVNTSAFNVVIGSMAENVGEQTFDYTLPMTFNDGSPVPLTNELPNGHQLLLLVFMSVDNDAGFADDNTVITIAEPTSVRPQFLGESLIETFPNPAREALTLKSDGFAGRVALEIIDLAGRTWLVRKMDRLPDLLTLPLGRLKSGAYFLRLSNNEETAILKFIKE